GPPHPRGDRHRPGARAGLGCRAGRRSGHAPPPRRAARPGRSGLARRASAARG
ncbi:MAG: hypothetical protein AVDCRST_MAG71-2635, partial [uncultured Lysobacter sp.]